MRSKVSLANIKPVAVAKVGFSLDFPFRPLVFEAKSSGMNYINRAHKALFGVLQQPRWLYNKKADQQCQSAFQFYPHLRESLNPLR